MRSEQGARSSYLNQTELPEDSRECPPVPNSQNLFGYDEQDPEEVNTFNWAAEEPWEDPGLSSHASEYDPDEEAAMDRLFGPLPS